MLNIGHGKLGKVMESHGILKASKSTNPEQQEQVHSGQAARFFDLTNRPNVQFTPHK